MRNMNRFDVHLLIKTDWNKEFKIKESVSLFVNSEALRRFLNVSSGGGGYMIKSF